MTSQPSSNNSTESIRERKLEEARKIIEIDGFCLPEWEPGFTLLCEALECKQSEMAAFLINSGVGVRNNQPLLLAAINGDIAVAKLLLERTPYSGYSIDAKDEHGQTPIFYSVQNADYPMFKLLLEHSASVKGSNGLLACAVKADCIDIVEFLLKEGVSANDKYEGKSGKEAIWYAVDNINLKMVRLLVAHGAELSKDRKLIVEWMECEAELASCMSPENNCVRDVKQLLDESVRGYKLLHAAVSDGFVQVVQSLLDYCSEDFGKNSDKFSPLLLTAACCDVETRNTAIIEMLLKNGANLDCRNMNRGTALHVACYEGNASVVELLLQSGADVKCVDNGGLTPLHIASCYGHTAVVEMLLKLGADVKCVDKYGHTPLHMACHVGHTSVVEILLKSGADVKSMDENSQTALHVASHTGNSDVVKMLVKSGADVKCVDKDKQTPLHFACRQGCADLLENLLKCGADVNSRDGCGQTPLHVAIKNEQSDCVCLSRDSSVNGENNGNNRSIPDFVIFNLSGKIKTIELLLEYGADMNIRNEAGQTPLHSASYSLIEFMEVLLNLKHVVDVNERNKNGGTALHLACEEGHAEIVDMLLKVGADVNIADNDDRLPITISMERMDFSSSQKRKSQTLTREMVKMISVGLYVSQQNVSAMSDKKIIGYKNKCEEEIALMKEEVFHDTLISFFSILIGHTRSVVGYLRNGVVLQVVISERYKSQYPIYSYQIENKLIEALGMKELIEKTSDIICSLVRKPIPEICIHRILHFLSPLDMKNVTDAILLK